METLSSFSSYAKSFESILMEFLFYLHGRSCVLPPNNALNFTTKIFTELSALFGVCPTFAATYHAFNNGDIKIDQIKLLVIL